MAKQFQCENCDLYIDMKPSRYIHYWGNRYEPVYERDYFATDKGDWCYDCLKKNDLLEKCKLCDKIMTTDLQVEDYTVRIEYLDYPNEYFRWRNILGSVILKAIRLYGENMFYVCEKNTPKGWYCLDCIEKINHIKIPSNYIDWSIEYNNLYILEPLGYKFADKESLMQNGKSIMKVTGGVYKLKNKRRRVNSFDRRTKKRNERGETKKRNRELAYSY